MTTTVFDSIGRLVDADRAPPDPAASSHAVRAIYVLALVSIALPAPTSGWIGMALGFGGVRSPFALVWLLTFVLIVWRIVLVIRNPNQLDAPAEQQTLRWCRNAAIAFMAIGSVIFALQWFVIPIARAVFPRGSDNGIEFFVVGIWLAMFAAATPLGLLLFEASRLFGFERWYR